MIRLARILIAAAAISFVLGFSAVWLTGCAALDRRLFRTEVTRVPRVETTTNVVAVTNVLATVVVRTNVVQLAPDHTDPVTGITTPATLALRIIRETNNETLVTFHTNLEARTNFILATNLVDRPELVAGLHAAGALPVSWAGVVSTALLGALGVYRELRNRRIHRALIEGIEAGRDVIRALPEGKALDTEVRDKLVQYQDAAGVLNAVSGLVRAYTKPRSQ
ncbi:MAG TPA: hypothetical protein VNO52_15845 [Methylomirabilota bacterium]|nr:hypothetical protein [Methylomirabilota bacterium]